MAQVTFKGTPVNTSGELPAYGQPLPDFELVGSDLKPVSKKDFEGKRLVLSFFPSVDTSVCAAGLRAFNAKAADVEETVVIGISKDLPFAHSRFCGAEDIENLVTGSAFRSSFGEDYGVTLVDGPMAGLLARGVVVTDANHNVIYSELVSEITHEPDYDAAIDALY